jgi:hypothetical protein
VSGTLHYLQGCDEVLLTTPVFLSAIIFVAFLAGNKNIYKSLCFQPVLLKTKGEK